MERWKSLRGRYNKEKRPIREARGPARQLSYECLRKIGSSGAGDSPPAQPQPLQDLRGDGGGGGHVHGGQDGEQDDAVGQLQQVRSERGGAHGCGLLGQGSVTAFPKRHSEKLLEKENYFKTALEELIKNYGPVKISGYDAGSQEGAEWASHGCPLISAGLH